MTAPEGELRTAWCRLAGVPPWSMEAARCEALLARLREPHRHYHTAVHAMWVLRHLADLVAADPAGVQAAGVDVEAVRWAALYHDAVYDPTRSDNEAVSAALAVRDALERGWSAERCATVERLVLATAHHRPTKCDEMLLVDADLAVLGASPAEYTAYVQGVRAEYSHVDEATWRGGRAAVLRGLLAHEPLFHTEHLRARREARARANLTAELVACETR